MNYKALGSQIRKRRRALGWTQERLAKSAHISSSFLAHIERGSRIPSIETFVNIANELGCGTDALIRDSLLYHTAPIDPRMAILHDLLSEICEYLHGDNPESH